MAKKERKLGNQSSEYKDAHYVGIAVKYLSVFRLFFVTE